MNDRNSAVVLLMFAAVFGLGYVVSLPPFGWGDEVPHFLRGLRVSRGQMIADVEDDERGVRVRHGIAELLRKSAHTTLAWKSCTLQPWNLRQLAMPVGGGPAQLAIEYGAPYAPVSSLHTGAAIWVAEALGAPPVVWLYAARLANLALWTLLMVAALRLTPAMHATLLTLMVGPTGLYVAATCSLDGLLNGLAFLWTAYVIHLTVDPDAAPSRKTSAIALCLIVPIALVKFVYAPLAFLLLLIPARDQGTRWTPWARLAVVGSALAIVVIALWLNVTSIPDRVTFLDTGSGAQYSMARLWTEPVTSVLAIPRTIHADAYPWLINLAWPLWTECLVGYPVTLVLFWGALVIAMLVDADHFQPTKAQRLVCLAISATTLALVILAAFASWTPLHEVRAVAVHSRYFLPVLPALAIAFMPPPLRLPRRVQRVLAVLIGIALATSLSLVEIAFVKQYRWDAWETTAREEPPSTRSGREPRGGHAQDSRGPHERRASSGFRQRNHGDEP